MTDHASSVSSLYDFDVQTIDGATVRLDRYRGQVLLIVNVASQCGYTPQYRGLEALYRQHHAAGFVVLGFPCDQFGHQEPGSNDEIRDFCAREYDVTFPMFAKVDVNGAHASPLFTWLKSRKKGVLGTSSIKWNFTKFLVGRDGEVRRRFGSQTAPTSISSLVTRLLS